MTRSLRFKDEAEFRAFMQQQEAKHERKGNATEQGQAIARANKFGAEKVTYDGIQFASKHEGARWLVLKQRMQAGEIRRLVLQQPINCVVNNVLVCSYLADFVYEERYTVGSFNQYWRKVYEDAKGYKRGAAYHLFQLKKKLVEALHGIEIKEV